MRRRTLLGAVALLTVTGLASGPVDGADEANSAPPSEGAANSEGAADERPADDVDALLAQLREAGRGEDGSGSSVRARRELDGVEATGETEAPGEPFVAEVESVKRQRFPLVLVSLIVRSAPADGAVAEGDRLVVLPRVRSRRGVIDSDDATSQRNIGAWYARRGDPVRVALEPRPDGQPVWVAARFERLDRSDR